MLATLASLAGYAVAGAMSSVPVSITILILLSPEPRNKAVPFLGGSLAGSLATIALSAAGLRLFPGRSVLDQVAFPAYLGIVAGAALMGYAAYLLRGTKRAGPGTVEKLRRRFESSRPWEYAALGVGLNLRPKAMLLAVAAGALIGVRNLTGIQSAALIAAYAVVAQSAVVGPVAYWLSSPERSRRRLAQLNGWLQRNGRKLTAGVVLAVGAFLAGYNLLQL